ncbi:MAG TPA: hypothetical protein VFV52_04890 [Bacilli bacterium]|nr:hypothetical protein [Bacilli bacterium]
MDAQAELRLARALYQLSLYLQALRLPFSMEDLYRMGFGANWREAPGALWLAHLAEDRYVVAGRHEFYTLRTVMETLAVSGLEAVLEALGEETARLGIEWGFLPGGHYRRRPPDGTSPDS